jgi:hypothetical protein
VTVTGISAVTKFNIFYWDSYTIDGTIFKYYINQEDEKKIDVKKVIDFLADKSKETIYDKDETYLFLFNYPTSYFLVGGRGHWSYAVNKGLLGGGGADAGAPSGGNASYNVRTTKKIKNKYYKKGSSSSSSSSSSKTTKKHKKTRRANKNKKRIKKTIKR